MKITESRANDILHWLDDETGNHALLFEKMTLHRDAAALIRQLQAEVQDAWHAGLDAGREQGRRNRLAEAAALEAAQMGLRYAVRVWVLSDEIEWNEDEIDKAVERIIDGAKKEADRG